MCPSIGDLAGNAVQMERLWWKDPWTRAEVWAGRRDHTRDGGEPSSMPQRAVSPSQGQRHDRRPVRAGSMHEGAVRETGQSCHQRQDGQTGSTGRNAAAPPSSNARVPPNGHTRAEASLEMCLEGLVAKGAQRAETSRQ